MPQVLHTRMAGGGSMLPVAMTKPRKPAMHHRTHTIGTILLGWLLALPLAAGPRLVIEPADFEWGRQPDNKGTYEFLFTLRNAGDAPLEITNVRPGCGCTKVDLKQNTLAAGESTTMSGVLDTKGIEGHMRKGIILTTTDPERRTVVANLDIRFPFNCQGLRMRMTSYAARLQRDALWVYVQVENCDAAKAIQIQGVEVRQGWTCVDSLPITVEPEMRQLLRLTRPVEEGTEPDAFSDLPFKILSDSPLTPELEGSISYRPRASASLDVTQPSASSAPKVRWPMVRPLAAAPAGAQPDPGQ